MNDTTLVFLVLLTAGLVGIAAALVQVARALRTRDPGPAILSLQQQIESLREQTRTSLEGGRFEIDRRLEETNRVVGEVRRGLGEVDREVRSVGATARELRGLQELLHSPKVRGGVGETLLGELLAQVLPAAHFTLEHAFRDGERVDAAVRVGDRWVPVDSKFPLDNFWKMRHSSGPGADAQRIRRDARRAFRSDIRRHVDAIAKRYVRPDEGTYEFALMYLPAEAVYQELLHQEDEDGLDLFHHCLNRRVVPVSPQSFYAYLQVIVLGLRGMSLERRSQDLLERLGRIRRRLDRFVASFDVVLRHVSNAQKQTEEASRRLSQLDAALLDLEPDAPARPPGVERAERDVRPSGPGAPERE